MNPLTTLTDHVSNLTQRVQELGEKLRSCELGQGSSTPLSSSPYFEPQIKLPEPFSGDRKRFLSFKENCKLYFRLCPVSSGPESQRVGIIISLLRGDPQDWAFSLPPGASCLTSEEVFFPALGTLYDEPDRALVAKTALRALVQGVLHPIQTVVCPLRME